MNLSVEKCVMTVFSLDPKEKINPNNEASLAKAPRIEINNKKLEYDEHPVLLGVKFDSQLTFRPHAEDVKRKMSRKRNVMTALAGKSFGADSDTLRRIYTACSRIW